MRALAIYAQARTRQQKPLPSALIVHRLGLPAVTPQKEWDGSVVFRLRPESRARSTVPCIAARVRDDVCSQIQRALSNQSVRNIAPFLA